MQKLQNTAALHNVAVVTSAQYALAFWSAVLQRGFLSELRSSRSPRGVGDRRTRLVPVCALLISVRDLQNTRFIERFT